MSKNPVIFIHGLWIHASAWQPWQDLFGEHGHAGSAPGGPAMPTPWPPPAPTPRPSTVSASTRSWTTTPH